MHPLSTGRAGPELTESTDFNEAFPSLKSQTVCVIFSLALSSRKDPRYPQDGSLGGLKGSTDSVKSAAPTPSLYRQS